MDMAVRDIQPWVAQYHRLDPTEEEEELDSQLVVLRLLFLKTLDPKSTALMLLQEVKHTLSQIQTPNQESQDQLSVAGILLLNLSLRPYLRWSLRDYHRVNTNCQTPITTA